MNGRDRRLLIGSLVATMAMAAGGGWVVYANSAGGDMEIAPVVEPESPPRVVDADVAYVHCLRGMSADAAERWAPSCRARADHTALVKAHAQACLRGVGSADAAERWTTPCSHRAEQQVAYTDCLRSAMGSPDAMERRADVCAAAEDSGP